LVQTRIYFLQLTT
jgi:hypothetical protein